MQDDIRADEGLTLLQWQKRFPGGKVPLEQAISVLRQLTTALHKVHFERPCHRDIIPSTVLVRAHSDGSTTFEVPDLGAVAESHGELGARRYLAPEQWWGGRQNTATDQYGLAVLFVELVTGKVPFAAAFETDDESVMRNAVCNHPLELPEDCPRREVLLRALSKDPRSRFHSCSSFLGALVEPAAMRPEEKEAIPQHGHRHPQPQFRRPRRKIPVVPVALGVALVGGFVFWGVRAGWFEHLGESREQQIAKRMAAVRKAQAEAAEVESKVRAERLTAVRVEIERQKAVADQALKDLQTFLETGGTAALTVRRDTVRQTSHKVTEDLAALEGADAADLNQERALAALRMHSTAYGNVSKDIPAESEVAQAYKALAVEAGRLDELSGKFTEKHPEVVAQRKALHVALQRFNLAVDGGLKRVQATRAARKDRLTELREKSVSVASELAGLEREFQVVALKQSVLERTRERESDRLAELRRKEFEIQFGSGTASTNRTESVTTK